MRVAPNLEHLVCISGIYAAIDLQSRFISYEPHYRHPMCRFLKLGRRFSHVCPANVPAPSVSSTTLADKGNWFHSLTGSDSRKPDWRSALDFPVEVLARKARLSVGDPAA
jgi:hypothetical protein